VRKFALRGLAALLLLAVPALAADDVPPDTYAHITNQMGGSGNPTSVTIVAGTCTPVTVTAAASNNSTSVSAVASHLCGSISIFNYGGATGQDVRFYDTASAPTCSSATGLKIQIPVPANATAANVAGAVIPTAPSQVSFTTGIGYCITGAVAGNDNTNATASNTVVNFNWASP
jgi:hypothetical protein